MVMIVSFKCAFCSEIVNIEMLLSWQQYFFTILTFKACIYITGTHFKLCIATATQNLKWVSIT